MTRNEQAFLDMLAWSELGRQLIDESDNGYNVLVGSLPGRVKLFHDYSDHPRQLIRINDKLSSTAAGRYQILKRTFDHYRKVLRLSDFSPASQDAIALRLIKERGAAEDVKAGRIIEAIQKIRKIWASLPGAGYGQREHPINNLIATFTAAGGQPGGNSLIA
ncbi:MAG: hypothetical protein VR65_10890 [Desulfobulbaceae bacterium BRH_c16a]|nr:MAG: hypothetical protein VR65_10890 [Desulfobulbaceae bacterium BRH_c16a]